MAALGNLIWFVFGGGITALIWLIFSGLMYATIIGAPLGRAFFEFAKLAAFPFGKEIIRDTELMGKENVAGWKKVIRAILNAVWFVPGLILTVLHFIAGIIAFISIYAIPVGMVYVRMGKFLLFPIGARVVSKKKAQTVSVVNEMERRNKG